MKKIMSFTLFLFGILSFSQTQDNVLVISNHTSLTIEGRLITCNPVNFYPVVKPISTNPSGLFTVPPHTEMKFDSFDTSGTAIIPVYQWAVTTSLGNTAIYNYNDPYITSIMPNTRWAFYDFRTVDSSGVVWDGFQMGDPNIYPAPVNTIQYGLQMPNVHAEWIQFADYVSLHVYEN
jgi:hypothetical protein